MIRPVKNAKNWSRRLLAFAVTMAVAATLLLAPANLRAQTPAPAADPAEALANALSAACRLDAESFAAFLTDRNAVAFRKLPEAQRTELLKRFVLLDDPGKPLISKSVAGHPVLRCEAGGVTSEVRFGATEQSENLAFIPVEIPQAADEAHSVRYGLVRDAGGWKLLSLGLLLLDVPALQQQWLQDELAARESPTVAAMRKIADALKNYQTAYGKLPEALDQLGPAPPAATDGSGGTSPEQAGLLDSELAAGATADYQFRYSIVSAPEAGDESERNKTAGFTLAAVPMEYGKTGKRSFYLDSDGHLHAADKHGAVASSTDPQIE